MSGEGIDHADALDWLAAREADSAQVIIFDPPYAVGSPVRGREDGAAGSVFGPLAFMSKMLALCTRTLVPGGIVAIFVDWRRLPDLGYMASTCGLRAAACVSWTRKRPGTGGLFRSAWDPILIVARGTPTSVDRAAVRNVVETEDDVVEADYPTKRSHPYGKPVKVFTHILARACKPGDLVLDPFAGSGASREASLALGLRWAGCDVDPAFARSTDRLSATTGETT
jgi:site-specific DNA-methyltransferase (adenine-specific)